MRNAVIVGIEPSNNYCLGPANEIQRCYIGLSRVAASASTAAWRYDSLGLYAPNSNGNAYFPFPGEKALVILDGATGEITARVPLEGDPNREPVTVGPIVGVSCVSVRTPSLSIRVSRRSIVSNSGRIEMIGLGGTAYLRQTSGATTIDQPVMDVATWTPRWSLPVEWSLLAAKPDGGAVAQNAAGDQGHFDGTGQLLGTVPALGLRNPVHESGGWIGASGIAPNTPAGLRKVEGTIEDATYFNVTFAPQLWTGTEQFGFGNQQRNLAPRQEPFPPLAKGAPGIGPHEAIYYALDDLIQRLKTDANLRSKAQQFVLGRVGSTVDAFVTYLERNRPRFYDGTKSTFCYWRLVGGPDAFLCRILPIFGQSVMEYMRTNQPTWALTWTPSSPLLVFFDPTFIGLNAEGKNLGNEALIFHVHG